MSDKTYRLQMTTSLHHAVKADAVKNRVSMQTWLEQAIKWYLYCQNSEDKEKRNEIENENN